VTSCLSQAVEFGAVSVKVTVGLASHWPCVSDMWSHHDHDLDLVSFDLEALRSLISSSLCQMAPMW